MFLNKRMSKDTSISIRTFLILLNKSTHLSMIEIPITFTILQIVIVNTMLMVVNFGYIAGSYLEDIQIQMLG
jgi:hypothetical protein